MYRCTSSHGPRRIRPLPSQVYGAACDITNPTASCQFQNPLALDPYAPASSLQCIRSDFATDASVSTGICKLGPQKHGDGCTETGECASGNCIKELHTCRGIDEGEECVPGFPDPCQPAHFCNPDPTAMYLGGRCFKSVNVGKSCSFAASCSRGSYCSGVGLSGGATCIPMFSLASGANTTIGPYMCKSGTALAAAFGPAAVLDVPSSYPAFQCVEPTAVAAVVGTECAAGVKPPMGYDCTCAADGRTRLRTLAGACVVVELLSPWCGGVV